MPGRDGTDPAARRTPAPDEGDGEEMIGTVIEGRYRLEATIGRGGMGLVYRAAHLGLRRQVAVKILHPSVAASPDVRNRFEREALASGKIDHPNCVSVYDSGRLPDGSLFLAMEFLDGVSLADVMEREGQLEGGRALHILAHILRGLSHIHAAGLIHRDIKPENIFLIRQGDDLDFAKILDFGIAKGMTGSDLDEGVKLTQAGMAFGTPIYMAPEQALGNPMDGRADIYGAAVMAYEMIAGQPPFYSDDKLEVMSMHTAKPVPPMRTRLIKGGKPVPSSLERLIVKGLTKKPSERYASADVFLAAVEAALATPDGGVTDVAFERPITGSQPLVDFQEGSADEIASAIDDVLSAPAIRPPVMPTAANPVGKAGSRVGVPAGGVGLGLPYTGPSGEPIFGLTPEQRLGDAPRSSTDIDERAQTRPLGGELEGTKKKWLLYGLVPAVAVTAGIVIAVVTTRGSGRVDGLPTIDPASPAGQANAALAGGNAPKAIEILEANKVAIAQDGVAQWVLGRAYAARHESIPALKAYDTALQLVPAVEADPQLRATLRGMAGESDPKVVAAAFEIWAGKTLDPEAKPLLLKAAVSSDLARRHAVKPVVERLALTADIDLFVPANFDLEQEETCELRKEAVSRLNALGDVRAIAPLERAIAKKVKDGPRRGKPFSPCLLDEAKATIGYLRGLAPKGDLKK